MTYFEGECDDDLVDCTWNGLIATLSFYFDWDPKYLGLSFDSNANLVGEGSGYSGLFLLSVKMFVLEQGESYSFGNNGLLSRRLAWSIRHYC